MNRNMLSFILFGTALFAVGYLSGHKQGVEAASHRVFELRTYYANPGKLDDLHARFRNHTAKIFEKHGMENIVYLKPLDEPLKDKALVYLLAYPDRDAAKKAWEGFRTDPDWLKARDASEREGKLVEKVDSIYLEPTDYSPMK